ncbi:cytochrome P450 [Archangium gephyra]|uniref:Cytochrome P450 n=1 Tax=Archangium gephyra TaxID=48 RepID=A0AAC8QHS1_9BACT|nr:cytochrome P450 [Archangium gephyra]AKJ07720.1 putative cytochrome P450 hydroxylase [Archangium gephyra]REG29472.1 cytochrome P450 [Archangium gephyra]
MSQRLNLLSPEFRENPYPFYARLRGESPVCQVDPHGFWAVSRNEDIVTVFKDPELFSSSEMKIATQPPWLGRRNPVSEALNLAAPPQHARLRGLVSRAFTQSMVSRMEPFAREVTSRLVDGLPRGEPVDFLSGFALGLPANIMALMMGVDPSLQKEFKRWSDDISGVVVVAPDDVVRQAEVRKTLDDMEAYILALIDRRRANPGTEDLVTDLLRVQENGERLTDAEVVSFLVLLLVAGLETTTYLLSHMALILARNPEWFERLRGNEALIKAFIEEVLRYEPPNHAQIRVTTRETTLGGVKLPAGAMVLLLLASGLRDEKSFPDAERFNPERGVQANLAFGHGIHFCLGAPLARMEARVALGALLASFSRFELATDRVRWIQSLFFRAPESLPLRFIPL